MGWDIWNQVLSDAGNKFANVILQNAEKERRANILKNIMNQFKNAETEFQNIENTKVPVERLNQIYKAPKIGDPNIMGSIGFGEGVPVQKSTTNPINFNVTNPNEPVIQQNPIRSINPTPSLSNIIASAPRGMRKLDSNAMLEEYTSQPTFTSERPLTRTEKYTKQSDIINNLLLGAITDPDAQQEDLQRAQLVAGLLQNKARKNAPSTPISFNLSEGAQQYITNEDGEVIKVAENVKDFNKTNSEKKIDTYIGDDGHSYTIMQEPSGSTYEIKSLRKNRPLKGSNIKINMPKEEKWGDMWNEIYEAQRTTVTDKEGVEYKLSTEEIQSAKNKVRNKAYSHLVPSAKKWYDENIKRESKGSWGRENISNADFIQEINEALLHGDITIEAHQDLLDFSAYRNDLWDLDTKSYKPENK